MRARLSEKCKESTAAVQEFRAPLHTAGQRTPRIAKPERVIRALGPKTTFGKIFGQIPVAFLRRSSVTLQGSLRREIQIALPIWFGKGSRMPSGRRRPMVPRIGHPPK